MFVRRGHSSETTVSDYANVVIIILYYYNNNNRTTLRYYAPPIGKGAISVALFVRPSVRPSVAYIANNSRTRRPSVPKFGKKVDALDHFIDATCILVSRLNGQRSLKAGGGIPCWPNRAATLVLSDGSKVK